MKKLFTLFTLALLTLLTTQAQDLNVWVLGNVGEQLWDPSVGTPMVYNAELGTYELTAHFNANSYFSFTTALAETSSDWDGITQYRFGAPANGYAIDDYLGESIQCGELGESSEQAFMVRKGADYKITLLMPDRLVMFEYMGNDDIEPDPKDEGHIYIMGAVNGNGNAWATNVGLQMTEKENNIFTANVSIMLGEGEELGYFGFTHALAVSRANWTAVAPFRFAAVDAESQVVVLDTPIALSEDGQSDLSFALPDGKYVVTLDMNARTMTVTADEANHMYIIGNVPFGDWNPSAGMAMDEVEEGVFQAKATVNGDVWFIFSPFNTGWDDVNANRYGPESAEEDQVIEAGETVTTQLTTSSRSYKVTGDGSEYTITFDLNNLCFKFEVDHEVINDVAYSYYIDPITHTATVGYSDSYAGLTDVVIPATVEHDGEVYTVTGIAGGAFRGCDLRSVSLYADITEGGNGFSGCTVGTLYVADNVTTMQGLGINPSAIYCFGNTPAQCDGSTFASYNAALHVPVAAMTDYFLAEVWSSFNNITADAGQQPETLTLDRQEATLELGASLQLTATVAPATVVPLRWASSNPAAVTVTDDGRLTALQAGEADITVTCMGLRQQCHVTVQGQAVVATIDPQELTLERGQSATLTATTSPIDAAVTWRSTDPAVATVTVRNGQATVAAVTTGEALIIATPAGDNVVPDTCRVTVTDITVIVTLDRHAMTMKRGETTYLTATTSPITADVTYSSSDTNVALVRVVGGRALVLANRPGEALIVATTAGELVRPDTCRVTVRRPKGDVNNDGLVDAGDVNNLINIVLGKVSDYAVNRFTDLTGDGTIDVADVNWLINVMLGKVGPEVETFTVNGVSFKMVEVEGGTFTMGATAEQGSDAGDREKPAHQVTLSGYSIGQTEVTQALWQAVMGSNPSNFTGDLQQPVEQVSWDDCQTFITKLNQMTGKNFRLPTEAEWEYAARGGNRSRGYKYAGSNNIDDVAWYYGNSGSTTHPVATKAPNELGLYDMSGNVYEWCQDWYGDYSSDAQTNPTGPASGSRRVNRGGSWISYAGNCRVSYRCFNSPSSAYGSLGLRLAL